MTPVDERLEKTLDYYSWFAPLAHLLLRLLRWLYTYLHNYGLAIIVLTVLMKLLLLPFTIRGERGMKQRNEMQKKLTYIQQRYKDDPEVLARERAELIRKYGVPGFGGCIPLLLQIPIFFALSRVLSSALELYQAPMFWISDLSTKDPYYILPVLVCLTMLLQALTADAQHRMSMIAMAFIFGAFASSFSAGLALYICVSTILGVLQTYLVKYIHRS
jgi:YidC/Oxa1 family membrane protein insertase